MGRSVIKQKDMNDLKVEKTTLKAAHLNSYLGLDDRNKRTT